MTLNNNLKFFFLLFTILFYPINFLYAEDKKIDAIADQLQIITQDLKTLEKAVYSKSFTSTSSGSKSEIPSSLEGALTRQLVKLSELEEQIQKITAGYEETLFKLQKVSERVEKIQKDTELRFSELDNKKSTVADSSSSNAFQSSSKPEEFKKIKNKFPGTTKSQDFAKTLNTKKTSSLRKQQQIQSVSPAAVVKTIEVDKPKILPEGNPQKQYQFATKFIKIGDYEKAEIALKEFIDANPNHTLTGNAQYWFAETFYIRQLYHDAAAAYLDGYQKYPKNKKAPQNLLKLGIVLSQLGEKDPGCLMLTGLAKQYPKAPKSIIQKAKNETRKFKCKKS